jgi:hypothetical protein
MRRRTKEPALKGRIKVEHLDHDEGMMSERLTYLAYLLKKNPRDRRIRELTTK